MNRSRFNLPLIAVAAAFLLAAGAGFAHAQSDVLVIKVAGKVDTKSAKAGDQVTAKTMKAAKLKDGTAVPSGSKLMGKVVSAESKQGGGGNSALAIKFDQLQVKSAAPVAITGQIVAIGPAPEGGNMGKDTVPMISRPGGVPTVDSQGVSALSSDDIPMGSTLQGVALANKLDADGATEMKGSNREIKLDSDVLIKVQLN
jgi:hypothetical protein